MARSFPLTRLILIAWLVRASRPACTGIRANNREPALRRDRRTGPHLCIVAPWPKQRRTHPAVHGVPHGRRRHGRASGALPGSNAAPWLRQPRGGYRDGRAPEQRRQKARQRQQCSTPTCTSTPGSPAPAARTATFQLWPGGHCGRGSRSSGPATSPILAGPRNCARRWMPAEPGLFRLRPELSRGCAATRRRSCRQPVRFMLSHRDIDDLPGAASGPGKCIICSMRRHSRRRTAITAALVKIGNLASDGRPILGLDSRHLLEITLNGGPGCYLVPAHIWTPWFAVLGSKSGFDSVADCYGDLAEHVFAVETGLSSDPPMNWMCSSLDGYRLVSNSDAHSPPMLGREATTLDTELDYFAIERCAAHWGGLAGTINFFPERADVTTWTGTASAGSGSSPAQTARLRRDVPGVRQAIDHRRAEPGGGAGRPAGRIPAAGRARIHQSGRSCRRSSARSSAPAPKSKKVTAEVDRLVAALGPGTGHPASRCRSDEVSRAGGSLLAEAVARLRGGEVRARTGYDGEYGVIRLFGAGRAGPGPTALFEMPEPAAPARLGRVRRGHGAGAGEPGGAGRETAGAGRPGLRGRQRRLGQRSGGMGRAAAGTGAAGWAGPGAAGGGAGGRPLMIIAGPGTGQDPDADPPDRGRHRQPAAAPEPCLAITFTRRAAEEMRERLAALLGRRAARLTVTTFHGLGLMILREQHELAGLTGRLQRGRRAGRAGGGHRAGRVAAGRPGGWLAEAAGDAERAARAAQALAARGPGGLRRPDRAAGGAAAAEPGAGGRGCASAGRGSASMSTRTSTRPSTSCCGCWPATAPG